MSEFVFDKSKMSFLFLRKIIEGTDAFSSASPPSPSVISNSRRKEFEKSMSLYHSSFEEKKASLAAAEAEEAEKAIEEHKQKVAEDARRKALKFEQEQAERKLRMEERRAKEQREKKEARSLEEEDEPLDEKVQLRLLANPKARSLKSSSDQLAVRTSSSSPQVNSTQIKQEVLSQSLSQSQPQSHSPSQASSSQQSLVPPPPNGQSLKRKSPEPQITPEFGRSFHTAGAGLVEDEDPIFTPPSPQISPLSKKSRLDSKEKVNPGYAVKANREKVLDSVQETKSTKSSAARGSSYTSKVQPQLPTTSSALSKSATICKLSKLPIISISHLKENGKAKEVHRIGARIVNFLPRDIKLWSKAFCSRCKLM